MSKSTFSSRVRLALLKGMEAIGTSASNLASNAKLKVNEINLENRRREILTDFSLQAFELWQKGVPLPGTLSTMLEELSEIENRLSVLRAQKYAKVAGGEQAIEAATTGDASVCTTNPEASVEPVSETDTSADSVSESSIVEETDVSPAPEAGSVDDMSVPAGETEQHSADWQG